MAGWHTQRLIQLWSTCNIQYILSSTSSWVTRACMSSVKLSARVNEKTLEVIDLGHKRDCLVQGNSTTKLHLFPWPKLTLSTSFTTMSTDAGREKTKSIRESILVLYPPTTSRAFIQERRTDSSGLYTWSEIPYIWRGVATRWFF